MRCERNLQSSHPLPHLQQRERKRRCGDETGDGVLNVSYDCRLFAVWVSMSAKMWFRVRGWSRSNPPGLHLGCGAGQKVLGVMTSPPRLRSPRLRWFRNRKNCELGTTYIGGSQYLPRDKLFPGGSGVILIGAVRPFDDHGLDVALYTIPTPPVMLGRSGLGGSTHLPKSSVLRM